MSARRPASWTRIALGSSEMAADAAWVAWLRSLRIAGGGQTGRREACLMVTEKVEAHLAWAAKLFGGELGFGPRSILDGSLTHYGRLVRANRRRLSARR